MSQVEINNLAPPYNTVAYLEATFADGNVFIGSGVMVGPNDVLTASHVVYSSVNGGVATSVKVILGYDPSPLETPYGTLSGALTNYNTGFDPNNDGFLFSGNHGPGLQGSELDYALVSLDVAIGDYSGWMGIDPNYSSGIVNITGYPGFYGHNPMNDSAFISVDRFDFIFHYSNTEVHPGNSGGPVWYSSNGASYVVSVVSTESWGAQLSGSIFNQLQNWISSNDYLITNADRLINGSEAADYITTGSGNDTINSNGGDDGIIAGSGNDIVNGGDGNDTIYGQDGTDTLHGNVGHDYLNGGAGNDSLIGDAGNDFLEGGPGIDSLNGGDGDDTYVVDVGGDTIADSSGMDTVQAYVPWVLGSGIENLTLLSSAAYGVGNTQSNVILGNSVSNALLRGLGGADTIMGGDGDDWVEGDSNGNDPFPGVAGNDTLYGDGGDDTLQGGAGDDLMYGGSGTDFLIADAGNDLVYGGSEWDAIDGRPGNDLLYGEEGDDIIFGDGYFYLFGFGDDTLYGGDGDDIMMGEAGEHYSFGGNDVMYGENGNDLLYGGAGNDVIYGGTGNDVIDGGDGFDYIVGGVGSEIMLGSNYVAPTSGSDLFVYQTMLDGGDSIYGFDTRPAENDAIDLRPLFDALGYAGTTPRTDGYLYVSQNGANTDVYVDANGATGGMNLTLMVTLVATTATSVPDADFLFQ